MTLPKFQRLSVKTLVSKEGGTFTVGNHQKKRLKRSGVDPPLSSSHACLHMARKRGGGSNEAASRKIIT